MEPVVNGAEPRSVQLVGVWVRLYTRSLPGDVRERRLLELESDMWEHTHDPDEPHAMRELWGRFLRGIPADVRWRYRTLLQARGARQRSHVMNTSMRGNWWAILTTVLGVLLVAMGVAMATIDGAGFGFVGAVTSFVTGALVISGLVVRKRDTVVGSRLIVAGGALTVMGSFELIPLAVIVLISGFWTGNLRLSGREDAPDLRPMRSQQVAMTGYWYAWLGAAAGLVALGFIPLIIEGDDLTWGYFIWIFSWLGAIVSAAVGVTLAGLRLVVRHRTRLA